MRRAILICLAFSLLSLGFSNNVLAKHTKRNDKWEASFKILNSLSTDVSAENGSGLKIDSDVGWGFTLGYNFNEHVMFNYDFSATTPKYDAKLIQEDGDAYHIKHSMNLYNNQFNVVYNFMTEQFTPFVQAGAGWSYVDSNIADGPPSSVCWWDPWWGGPICEGYQNTYDDTRFSYNVAAGVRYELDNSVFFRASYQQNWIDLSHSDDLSLGIVHLEIGSIF